MNLGPHADFIIASYALTALAVAALIGWIAADHRAQSRLLADLEQRGVARRSRRTGTDAAGNAT